MIQLNRLVTFHKALADPSRIRIIALLKEGPLHGQAIANKLGLKPPTITHHIKKLRDTGIIYERRDRNTIYIHLDIKKLTYFSDAILKIGAEDEMNEEVNVTDQEKLTIVRNFIQADGKLKNIPSQRKKKLLF